LEEKHVAVLFKPTAVGPLIFVEFQHRRHALLRDQIGAVESALSQEKLKQRECCLRFHRRYKI
jgi:hypothetical protein